MNLSFRLKPSPPFSLKFTAWALRRRPENIVDRWDGGTYHRVLALDGKPVETDVVQLGTVEKPTIRVTVTYRQSIPELKLKVKMALQRMLGLKIDLSEFYLFAGKDKKLKELSERFVGLKPPRFPDLFEALTNAFSCQQLSLHVGILLLNRLAMTCGLPFKEGASAVFSFAQPQKIADTKTQVFRKLGFSRNKTRFLRELAQGIVQNRLDLDFEKLDNESALAKLYQLSGVGRWSGEYVLLRGLGRTDIFPGDDVGAQNKLKNLLNLKDPPNYEGVKKVLGQWRPYGGLIYFHLLLEGLRQEGRI
jgi:DNA-3-methyladenine glycosylase II